MRTIAFERYRTKVLARAPTSVCLLLLACFLRRHRASLFAAAPWASSGLGGTRLRRTFSIRRRKRSAFSASSYSLSAALRGATSRMSHRAEWSVLNSVGLGPHATSTAGGTSANSRRAAVGGVFAPHGGRVTPAQACGVRTDHSRCATFTAGICAQRFMRFMQFGDTSHHDRV